MLQQSAERSRPNPLRRGVNAVYAFFYNKKVGILLILITGALGLIGSLTRQMPAGIRTDPVLKAQWLDEMRPIYGGWTNVVDFVGIFNIFSSPIFIAVAILLAISIAACTTHRIPNIFKSSFRPKTTARDTYFDRARYSATISSPLSVEETRKVVLGKLAQTKHRVIEDEDGTIFSDKWHLAPFFTAVAHTGYVTVMAAFLVSAVFGFRNENFDLTVGIPQEVGHGTGLTAEALSFRDSYHPETGSPIDYVADLALYRDGKEVARQEVRVNEPLIIDGMYFHQANFGVSAVMKVVDTAKNEVLFDGGTPLLWRTPDGGRQYGVILPEGRNIEIFVIANASGGATPGLEAGQVRVEMYDVDSNVPRGQATIDARSTASIDGLDITFEREQKYTSLIVKKDPGSVVMWIGSFLLIVGTMVTMGLRHRRQLIRVRPDGAGSLVLMGSSDRNEGGRRRHFEELAQAFEEELNGSSGQEED